MSQSCHIIEDIPFKNSVWDTWTKTGLNWRIKVCVGLTLAGKWTPTQPLAHSPSAGWEGELEGQKARKFMGWDKGSLINEGKNKQKNKTPSDVNVVPHYQPTDAQPDFRQPFLWKNYALVLLLNMMLYGIGYLFGQYGSAVQLCPLQTPCSAPVCQLGKQSEKLRMPWHCVSTSQQQPKHW